MIISVQLLRGLAALMVALSHLDAKILTEPFWFACAGGTPAAAATI